MDSSADRALFKSETLEFFRAITNDSLEKGKLCLPKKLVQEHRYAFTNPLQLKVANQTVWQVEFAISERTGSCWLQNGFKEFVQYYGLRHEYLLLFEYERAGCHFNVRILSNDGCEIGYPLRLMNDDRSQEDDIDFSDLDSDDEDEVDCIIGNLNNNAEEAPRTNIRFTNPVQASGTLSESAKKKGPVVNMGGQQAPAENVSKAERKLRSEETYMKPVVGIYETGIPYFGITMSPTYLDPNYMLGVPADFAKEHFRGTAGIVKLVDENRREWRAKYYNKVIQGKVKARIYSKWKRYAMDKGLVEGDACFFELVDKSENDITLKVVIKRRGKGIGKDVNV